MMRAGNYVADMIHFRKRDGQSFSRPVALCIWLVVSFVEVFALFAKVGLTAAEFGVDIFQHSAQAKPSFPARVLIRIRRFVFISHKGSVIINKMQASNSNSNDKLNLFLELGSLIGC